MKIKLTFKTPDAVYDALNDSNIDDDVKRDRIYAGIGKYVEYGEYLTVEYDTETKTMVVVPCK